VQIASGMTLSVSPATSATFADGTSGAGAITKAGAGTQTFSGTLNHSGGLRVSGGTAVFAGAVSTSYTGGTSVTASGALLRVVQPLLHPGTGSAVAGVSVAAGGTVEVSSAMAGSTNVVAIRAGALAVSGTSGGAVGRVTLPQIDREGVFGPVRKALVLDVQSVSVANDGAALGARAYYGFVDVGNNDMIIRGGAPQFADYWDMGRAWFSSYSGADAALSRGLGTRVGLGGGMVTVGMRTNDSGFGFPEFTTFSGQSVAASDVLVKFTYLGDTDFSGGLDDIDYNKILYGWSSSLSGWQNGDTDYSGLVDGTDFWWFSNVYEQVGGGPPTYARGWVPPEGWYLPENFTFADAVAWGRARGMEYVPPSPARPSPSAGAIPEPAAAGLLAPAALLVGRAAGRRRR
jgi:autotransporter-associated beta strand protein